MMRKILIVTSGRADYGLLYWLMRNIKSSENFELQIIATGMHLSPEFGLTYKQIESDGFVINKKVELLLSSDTSSGMSKSMGLGMIAFSTAFEELNPDLMIVLGDRYEIFAATATALVQKIPVAHIHGGEVTQGAMDDAFRHSITKMSNIHFCAADEYKRRILQLGEDPQNVFMVGGLGIDYIKKVDLLSREEIEEKLSFKLRARNLLITFHPETLSDLSAENQIKELLAALDDFNEIGLIFTMPNADTGGRAIAEAINQFVQSKENALLYNALGQTLYLSCIDKFDGVIGNSSSGILEVPSFKRGTLNIGNRQRGRLLASSIISCSMCQKEIRYSIHKLLSGEFKQTVQNTINPYGDGGASDKILEVLKRFNSSSVRAKAFFDQKVTVD